LIGIVLNYSLNCSNKRATTKKLSLIF